MSRRTRRLSAGAWRPGACELWRKVGLRLALVLALLAVASIPARVGAQREQPGAGEAPHTQPADTPAAPPGDAAGEQPGTQGEHGTAAGHEPADAHGARVWSTVAKLLNFAILAGTLVYFLRSPLMGYMRDRAVAIREALVTARQMTSAAQSQLEEIDRRMRALPGELEELKARGLRDVAAEEARIRQSAEAERARLVEQTRRDLDLQVRAARRELVAHAADLAVGLASDRIKTMLTNDDHARLADRFIRDVSARREAS